MQVMDYIKEEIQNGPIHMSLIDPDEQAPEVAGKMAKIIEGSGSHAIMVGGSTGIVKEKLDSTVKAIKENTDLPVILFPVSAGAISEYVDAIYFMSMLNSQDIKKVIGEQVKGAPYINKSGLEPLSMAYLIVEPGMTVGEVGKANAIPRDEPEMAVSYGLAAQYFGMDLLYLEAGSGAPSPVPTHMIRTVKEKVDIPLIVGGGIREKEEAERIVKSGADVIVTGTILEESVDLGEKLERLISAIKK